MRLLGWLSRRVGKRIAKNSKKESEMANAPQNQPPNGSTTEIDASKFLISKNVMSIITHSVVPVLCVIVFNVIRAAKPDWLWAADMDQHAIDQISNTINELLTGICLLSVAWGHAHDVVKYKQNKDKDAAANPPTT